MKTTTPDAIDPPANVLLVQPPRAESDACRALCDVDGRTATLTVTFTDDRIERPYPAADETLGVLVIGDVLTAHSNSDWFDGTGPIVTDSVADPTDLTAIGVAISRFCERWSEGPVGVCFDSLDALLAHAPPKDAFQFTHVLTTRLAAVGAAAHVHFDPTDYEDRVLATFATIFDDVVADAATQHSLTEATDDDVAALLAEWEHQPPTDTDRSASVTEATDDDIAALLDER